MSLLPIYYNSNRLTPKRRKKKECIGEGVEIDSRTREVPQEDGCWKIYTPLKTERPQKSFHLWR